MGTLRAQQPTGSREEVWIRQQDALAPRARRAAADFARRLGFQPGRIAEIELAVTEAAVNLTKHAVDGALLLRISGTGPCTGVELLTIDQGPGIADVARSRRDGVSSAGTLGIGLGVVDRMANHCDVHSLAGRGTVLVARFTARSGDHGHRPERCPEPLVAGLTRPVSGETVCGDAWAAQLASSGPDGSTGGAPLLVMLSDGLGHGPLAARASEQAVIAFQRAAAATADPTEIMSALHRALAGTRGAAAAVAAIDTDTGHVGYCGVGNISGFVVTAGRRSTLLSLPGIVGHHLPRLRAFEGDLSAGASLVLHSDGLTERWNPATLPGVFEQSSTVVAAQLMREAGVRKDDASAVVVKRSGAVEGAR